MLLRDPQRDMGLPMCALMPIPTAAAHARMCICLLYLYPTYSHDHGACPAVAWRRQGMQHAEALCVDGLG
jgi:hypothetical protein